MRVLFLTHYFPPEGNAPATRVHALCQRWVQAGHEVTVITCAPNVPCGKVYDGYRNKLYQTQDMDGIKVVRVWTFLAANRGTFLRTMNFVSFMCSAFLAGLFQKRPNLVIATSPQFFCGWAGALTAVFRRAPFVLEVRDLWPASIAAVGAAGLQSKKRRWLLRILEFLERRLYRSAKHIVTVGDGYRDKLEARGVPADKISVVTNGVNTELYQPAPPDPGLRERHGLTGEHLVVSYIGTVGMASGLDVTIPLAHKLKERGLGHVRLMIVGDGAIREELEQKADEAGLDNLLIVGRRPKEEMAGYLSITDVCLIHLIKQDLFRTVLPSKIFEATAMRRPILLGVEGYAADLIATSGAGVCVEPENVGQLADAIEQLAGDPALRDRLGQCGYDYFVPRYNIDTLAADYLSLAQRLARPDKGSTRVKQDTPQQLTAPTAHDAAAAPAADTSTPPAHDPTLPTVTPTTATSFPRLLAAAGRDAAGVPDRPVVCVQGLGHVGSAMSIATATARDAQGRPRYNVVGVELDNDLGREKAATLSRGGLPFASTDQVFLDAAQQSHDQRNFVCTTDPEAYGLASIVVVDIPFDVDDIHGEPRLPWDGFKQAIRTVGMHAPAGALVLVETTVPPGTCEKVVAPLLAECMRERGLPEDALLLAHSFERVMPGPEYYDSIVNFWRVVAGHSERAGDAAEAFLQRVINTEDFPMTRLQSTTASETAKVMENSYRAVNIAFAEEWGRFAETLGFDLYEVINAIRVRPTHNNMRQPGFGVGGYCLTKDPLMAGLAARDLFEVDGLQFPFCRQAVATNHVMPLVSLDMADRALGGLEGKRLLLLGVSYRSDVSDTRSSPSEPFVREAIRRGAEVACHDPLVTDWREMDGYPVLNELPTPDGFDAVVFAVAHDDYRDIEPASWLNGQTPLVLDANNVLTGAQRDDAKRLGCRVYSIGRGEV